MPALLVAGVAAFLAVTWARSFGLPLGDSHEGRVLGQFTLHVRNFWELGPVDSSFGADWRPFSDVPYTHHPPLLTGIHLLVSSVIGQGLWQLKAVSYLAGLATVPVLALVGRRLGFGAMPVAVAVGALVATPWWWIYGRLGLGFLPNLLMIAAVLTVADRSTAPGADSGTGAGTGTGTGTGWAVTASLAAVAASWHGVFLAPLLWVWLWRRRGLDRVVVVVGAAMAAGALVVLLWVAQGAGLGELGDHAGRRIGVDRTVGEFLDRQWTFARGLLPGWYQVLAVPALVAGLADHRSRALTGMLVAMVVVFAVVPSDNAWIHDYWNFPVLLALFPGFAALADRVLGAQVLAGLGRGVQVAAVAMLLVGALVVLDPGDGHHRAFATPAEAGYLLDAVGPAPGQEILWHTPQVAWPTWGSATWGLPPGTVATRADVATVSDGDRVVLRLDRLPAFVDRSVADDALAVRAPYAVVTGADLRRHLSSD
jgi:hypothetical protein